MLDVIRQASGRLALARWHDDGGAHEREVSALAEPAIKLAKRAGIRKASDAKLGSLTQTRDLLMGQDTRGKRFRNRRTIRIVETSFALRAKAGPFGAISACDHCCNGVGTLDVNVFGLIRHEHMDGPAIAKGEIMRYLAEFNCTPFVAKVGWCVVGHVSNYRRGTFSIWDVA